ncbi:MAG TPA: hypothetical protein VG838_03555 [Opitutaceae bacterium]|nr:hypothetical protein [Opitutaceae bacterium]
MAAAAIIPGRDSRRAGAMEIVRIHTGLCVAAHFVPAPGLSSVFIAGIHLQMIEALARHYGAPFNRDQAGPVLQALALGATHGLISRLPIFSSWLRIAIWPALLAAYTHQVGKSYVDHYESGGRFEDFKPEQLPGALAASGPA